jgi:hypothetical protein
MTEQLESQLRQALAARAAELPRGSSARLRQLDYHPRTRSVRPPVAAGVLVAAGAAATVALVGLGTNTQEAFAGWTPTPTAAQKGQLAAAEAACQNRSAAPMSTRPAGAVALPKNAPPPTTIDPGSLKPALTDTRGPFTFVILAGDHGSESCITGPSFTSLSATATTGSTSVPAGKVVLSSTHMTTRGGQAFSFAQGHTGSDVTGATLVLDDGTKVEASAANGWFVAWWPGSHNVTSALVTTPSGTSTEDVNTPAARGCPQAPTAAHTVTCASGSIMGVGAFDGKGGGNTVHSGGGNTVHSGGGNTVHSGGGNTVHSGGGDTVRSDSFSMQTGAGSK